MAGIGNLFDFQKIAGNKELSRVIDDVEDKYGTAVSEDELELVSAGMGDARNTVEHHCDKCNALRTFRLLSGGRAVCTFCQNQIMM